jgi:hypothetical protein
MLTKFQYITNLKKLLQVGILTVYRASVSSPFNRSPCLGKCLSRQSSFWADVLLGKRLLLKSPSGQMSYGQMSFLANAFLGKYFSGQMSYGQTSSGQMFFWSNVFLGKHCQGKCPSGQMSYGQMSLGKRRMGKRQRTLKPTVNSSNNYKILETIKVNFIVRIFK